MKNYLQLLLLLLFGQQSTANEGKFYFKIIIFQKSFHYRLFLKCLYLFYSNIFRYQSVKKFVDKWVPYTLRL